MRSRRRLAPLLASLANAHSRVWYSRPGPDDRLGTDYDELGHLTADAMSGAGVPIEGEFYVCGPAAFMSGDTDRPGRSGRADGPGALRSVRCRGAHHARHRRPRRSGRRTCLPGTQAQAPLVSFVRTGLNVRWDDRYASILELAEACDVPVRWSCRTGVCHTCETGLLEGEVRYAPGPLEPPAAGNLLVCCAQPSGGLVVDL